ncbi:unnamed protein product [Closterium sp. NIES-65]|nr:unnamed protein product [Closterium sp. NIES-65]
MSRDPPVIEQGLFQRSDNMAAERVASGVNELIKEAVLAAVREELAAHKEEVKELQHMLTAVNRELTAVKGELIVVKGGLAVVKGGLAEHEDAMAERLAESRRASDARGLREKSRKRKQETTANFAREEEGGTGGGETGSL